jgi:glycosyltransferase involved in cell wall biosynthesis
MIDWFDPAYKAGGPIRSCVNLVDQLHGSYELYVMTSAYDLGDVQPLQSVQTGCWTDYHGQAKVWYATRDQLSFLNVRKIIKALSPDYIYLNGIFSFWFTTVPLLLKRFGLISGTMVLAPRGMLKSSALVFKSFKKKVFIQLFRMFGFHRAVRFQATDQTEKEDILRFFPNATVWVIPNLPGAVIAAPEKIIKEPGSLKLMFTGRIHPIKNLDLLLRSIREVKGKIELTIAGVLEDAIYWQHCQTLIRSLSEEKVVRYLGEQKHDAIISALSRHHLFALPTRGENFGHAIFEALSIGRPALVSDQTPWRNLASYPAGWDLPLGQESGFTQALQEAVDWSQSQYDHYSKGALDLAQDFMKQSPARREYIKFFS